MKFPDLRDSLGRVRLMGMADAISYLLLLGVAMPLKYAAGQPAMVKIVGPVHGVFVIGLILTIFHAWGEKKMSAKMAAITFIASLLPFGPFVIDKRLSSLEDAETGPAE